MIISLIFAVANAYFAFNAFKDKRWGWCAFSSALCGLCTYQVVSSLL